MCEYKFSGQNKCEFLMDELLSNPILTKQREINQQKYRNRERLISLKYQFLHSKEFLAEVGFNYI